MRKVKISRLTKVSRNARIMSWPLRTGKPLGFVRNDGRLVAVMLPYPEYEQVASIDRLLTLMEEKDALP